MTGRYAPCQRRGGDGMTDNETSPKKPTPEQVAAAIFSGNDGDVEDTAIGRDRSRADHATRQLHLRCSTASARCAHIS
jgi:hypothetical protein